MRIEIKKIVYPGRRLGLLEGKVVFTDRGLPGETVEIEILKDRKSYTEARTLGVVSPSPSRVEPRCAHFIACSSYQDMDYGLELEVKKAQVAEILSRELKRPFDDVSMTPSPEVWGYRNRIRLRVQWESGAARFVYNEPGEQASFVAVDRCHLVPDRTNDILTRLLEIIEGGPFPSVAGVEVRTSRANGQSLVVCDLESGAQAQELGAALALIKREFALVGAVASIYDGKKYRDERLFGRDFLEESVRGLTFRIGARSFFQTNIGILEKVFDDVAAAVAPQSEAIVADLYCGLGTFGVFLAKTAREVFGVEPAAENIAFLKKNLALNRVGNFAVCEGTTEEWLGEIMERAPGVVVLDPPRKGVDPRVVAGLVEEPVPLLLYLSCNPTTLARDLKGLLEAYVLADLRIYDFFPHTPHIETLAVLIRGHNTNFPFKPDLRNSRYPTASIKRTNFHRNSRSRTVPRIARVVIPGCPHHVIQRGNRRLRVFFSDEDKAFYLTLLRRQILKHGISIWAFCLMDNHVHLIAVPKAEDSFARGIGEAHRRYTNFINTREDWKGYLWQGRFISYPLDDPHLYTAVRYIERNPVRARVVKIAEDYAWSSARAHVRMERHPLLSPYPLENGIRDWSAYLKQKDSKEDITKFVEHEHTGRPLGTEDFIKRLEELTGRILAPMKRGRKKSEIGIVSPI